MDQKKASILVVDDKPANLRLLAKMLTEQGYTIRLARDGRVGLSSALSLPPDLILLDIQMPHLNGYQVCERLKSDPSTSQIPVIFISALDDALDKVKAFSVGGIDYITKPFQVEEVLARVETHLALRGLQKQLTLAKEVAEAANQAKSKFLSNMSHELRTPLNAILGFAQIMTRSQTLAKEDLENLGIIYRSGEHLLTLINNVLDLSKIEAGHMSLNKTSFDLYRLLDDLEDMFSLKVENKRLHLLFERIDELPQYVRTDSVKLRQILINLLNNAIKFTEEGGISVQIKAKSAAASHRLYFEVQDSGVGIAPDELETLFEAFVQTESGRQAQEGTGLGLAISRKFVQLMGGEIRIRSQVGHGTVFAFDTEVEVVSESAIEGKLPARRVIALEPNQPRYRILIVDDKANNRLLLMKLLSPLGFELREAANGQEALDIWEEWAADLIWMDMQMPVMNGYEATKRIKKTTKGQATPIVALTASTLEEERAVVLSAGCDDFMRKPFREAEIFDMMHKQIGVRYVYEERTPLAALFNKNKNENEDGDGKDSPIASQTSIIAGLAALPSSLIAELEKALEGCDMQQIQQAIEKVVRQQPILSNKLTNLANDFFYDEILDLLDEAKGV